MTCFVVVFTLLPWSGTEATISPRYACTFEHHIFIKHILIIVNLYYQLNHLHHHHNYSAYYILSFS